MEIARNYEQVKALVGVLPDISEAMCRAEEWIVCHDQEKVLLEAVEEVMDRARRELSKEYLAARFRSKTYIQREVFGLVAHFAIAALGGPLKSKSDHKAEPPGMGNVLIAVGPEGIPVDLSVFNISGMAHQDGTPESWVEKAITDKGYSLFTLQGF